MVPLVPQTKFYSAEKQGSGRVSIDPGERSFITTYSEKGDAYQIGYKEMKNRILPILKKVDRIQSYLEKNKEEIKSSKKKRLKLKMWKLKYMIKNMINELHHKVAYFLCLNYNEILIPHFESKRMTQSHCLSHEVNRRLLSWNHYKFREILKNKASKFLNCKVKVISEEYTSKTCGSCGTLKYDLKGDETYKCSSCGVKIDRDLNGARNIYLKFLSKGK